MAATCALVRRQIKRLTLVAVPTASLQADLLVGAGCVVAIEAAGLGLGEHGPAPRVSAAILNGEVLIKDTTCPAVYARLQAAEKGIPFMPLRGLIGSDLLRYRPDWRVIDNPFSEQDPIVLLPALSADVALFHAPLADRLGNVWIGCERELILMAHAARQTVVTVEKSSRGICCKIRSGGQRRWQASMSAASPRPLGVPRRCACRDGMQPIRRSSRPTPSWRRPRRVLPPISNGT